MIGLRPGPRGARFEVLDRFSLRTRIGVLAALAAALSVVLVCAAAFFTVRANILDALDANLLQRATAAAQSDLVNPQQLATIPTEVFGAGDIRLALLLANGRASSAEGYSSAPPLGTDELRVARGIDDYSVRTATDGRRRLPGGGRAGRARAGAGDRATAGTDAAGAGQAGDRVAGRRRDRGAGGRAGRVRGGPGRAAAGGPADRGDRARRGHRRPAPDPGGRLRRAGPAHPQLQRDAAGAGRVPGAAAPAGRRRRTRAAHPADLDAHQPGAARLGEPAGGSDAARSGARRDPRRRAGAGQPSCRRWSATWSSWPATTPRRWCTRRWSSPTSCCGPWSGPGGGPATSSSCRCWCRGRWSATPPRWSGPCSTCSTTPPSGARPAVVVRVQMRPLDDWSILLEVADRGPGHRRRGPAPGVRPLLPRRHLPHHARFRARAGHRAAGGGPARRRRLGGTGARGRRVAGDAAARSEITGVAWVAVRAPAAARRTPG